MALTKVSRGLLSTGIVDNSNATAITIDSSENVGIGTSSPSTKLQVTGNSSSRNTIVSNVTLDGGTAVAYPYSGFGFGINFIGRDYGNAVRNYASINTLMEASSSSSGGGDAGFKSGLSFYTNGGGASGTNPTERMRIDSSGNVAIGSTSATARLEVTGAFAYASGANSLATTVSKAATRIRGSSDASTSLFFGSLTNDAEQYIQSSNGAGSAADDLALNPYGGNVSINHASPTAVLDVRRGDASGKIAEFHTSTGFGIELGSSQSEAYIQAGSNQALLFNTNGSNERMRIRSNGTISFATDGNYLTNKHYNFRDAVGIDNPSSSSYSVSTSSVLTVGSMSTGRSINATGTINASGADYAEYMYKADGCGAIAKGDVVGVDINGKLTDVFADSISFVIKSTNPSYVGGDTWADEEPPSKDTAEWDSWYERTETKRATVDRIAFSGQVPVNITGSFNVGDYIYPEVNGSGIKAVAKPSPTFDEYKLCVGKIWATEKNGKPYVAVKIG